MNSMFASRAVLSLAAGAVSASTRGWVTRVHRVGERRIEKALHPVGSAQKAATMHEHDRVAAGLLCRSPTAARVLAGDVSKPDAVAVQDRPDAEHEPILASEHECIDELMEYGTRVLKQTMEA